MIKRLLNPHTLLKITLILTTLQLPLPNTAWAGTFSTQGNSISNSTPYTWVYGGGSWTITTSNAELSFDGQSSLSSLKAAISSGGSIKLSTTNPLPPEFDERLSSIRIEGTVTGCSISFKFQKTDGNVIEKNITHNGVEYMYTFEEYLEWEDSKSLEIIISATSSSSSCDISSIIFHTKQRSTATFTWPESPTPKSGNNDIGSFKKVVLGDNGLQLQGRCLNKTEFYFPLVCNQSVSITYSSNNSEVAEVDEDGVVRVNSEGQAVITATPEATNDIFYEQSSYSYTLDITSIDGLCIDGTFVNFNNKDNIQCDAIKKGKVSYNSQYQTLTLDGVTIDGTISSSINDLKIDLKGTNVINAIQSDSSAIQTWDGAGEINLVISSTNTPKGTLTMTALNRETIYGYKVSYSNNIIGADYDHYSCIGEDYNLTIAQKAVNSVNASNVLRDGYQSARYDYSSSTLTLKGANLESEDITIGEGINTLNIQLIGYNQVSNIISSNSATTINVTTSETLPGSLHYYGSIPETIVFKNNLRQDNREISVEMNNTTYTPFTGYVDYATESYIYCGSPDYNASVVSFSNKTVIVSSPNDGTTATLYPSSISNLNLIKKVYFQFDWGTSANKNVSLQIRGIKQNTETYNYEFDGKTYSENVSLNTTYEDGIVEIPITGTITSPNIELYFTSNATFSFVPLAVAMENYESYDISFNNELVSELNKNDIFGDGKASYDPEGHILTLKGVDLKPNGPSEVVGWNYMGNKNLTVILEDENTITNALFYNRGGYPDVNIRFFTETTKPGSLTMKKTGDSNPSVFNQENYIRSFKNIVYDNTYYDYSTSGNEAEGYTGIYKVSLLKPEINCEETEDGVQLYISDPSESNGTIKYSVVYGDGSEGITDAEYSESPEVPTIEKPATITAYIESGEKKSGTITAYYFGFADDLKTTFNGTEREILKDEFPALIPSVEGIDYMLSNSDNPNAICLKTVDEVDHIMIKGFGTANLILNINHNANIIVLNSGDGAIALKAKVIPSAPTFSVVAGTYDETQTLELTSPYQNDQTINIKYYTDSNSNNPVTYTEQPISISQTTTITAWVEALITSAAGGAQETITSDTITQEYIIKEEAFIDFMQEENDKYITIEAGQVITGTYGNTIPQVVMQSISDLHGTITFSSSNETVVASSSISLDEENKLKYTVSGAGQTTIQASYTPTEEEPILPTTSSFNLKIEPRAITNATISMGTNGETSFVYKGTAIEPITSVSLAASETAVAATLNAETDFDLNYYMVSGETETEQEGAPTNVGSYKVTVNAKGNYTGSKSATFTITPATITPKVVITGWAYGATANTPTVSGNTGNGSVTYEYKLQNAEDSKYSTEVPTEAGDYTIKATIAATANYEAAVDSTHFTISKANINPTITLEGWTFGATANTPEVTGNTGNGAETFTYKAEGSEAFTSEVPTAVGTHIVKVTIAETTNYNGGEATATFTIINRTFNPANDITFAEGQSYASFYSSSEDLELPKEGIAVFMITGLNGNTLTTQAVSYIPKGVPVLVMKASGTTQAIDPNEVSSNMLQYATSDVNADGTAYILYNGEYVRATGIIPAGKCYLKLNKPSGARKLTIGNETTGIDRLDNTVWTTENWFDLNGRRIEKPTKNGLYIMNGKKVVVK